MNQINPYFELHGIPKVWSQASPETLPMVKFHKVTNRYLGDIPKEIPKIMKKHDIRLLVLWHIPWEYFPIMDSVHKIGGKVINWQTIHWKNDMLFLSDRLNDFDWWVPATNYAEQVFVESGLDRNKMTTIPHAVNLDWFFPHDVPMIKNMFNVKPDQKTILFVGRCQLTKGIVPMMLIARKLCERFNCHIVFKAGVHDGVWKSREIGYLLGKMTKWEPRIHFLDKWTTPLFMEQLTAGADILVCPSGHEGSSLPPLETMACGKPVAITDIPVHRELLGGRNGECGLLMPPSDPTEYVNDTQMVKIPSKDMLYGTLKYLLENPDEAKAMGEEGLKRATEYYDMKKICTRWFELLGKIQ